MLMSGEVEGKLTASFGLKRLISYLIELYKKAASRGVSGCRFVQFLRYRERRLTLLLGFIVRFSLASITDSFGNVLIEVTDVVHPTPIARLGISVAIEPSDWVSEHSRIKSLPLELASAAHLPLDFRALLGEFVFQDLCMRQHALIPSKRFSYDANIALSYPLCNGILCIFHVSACKYLYQF